MQAEVKPELLFNQVSIKKEPAEELVGEVIKSEIGQLTNETEIKNEINDYDCNVEKEQLALEIKTEETPFQNDCQTKPQDFDEKNFNISFEDLKELHDDMTIIENETTLYKCQICGIVIRKFQEYRLHKKNHYIEKRTCNICKKVQQSLGVLEEHVNKHLGLKPYKCNECDKGFASKNHLSLHKKCHSTEQIYHCKRCDKVFRTRASLRSHQIVHSEKVIEEFRCKVCGHLSENDTQHREHMTEHAKKSEIQCGLCRKPFNTERGLESHLSTHKELKFPCEYCGKIYPSMYRIKRHIKRAHIPNKCQECNEIFYDRFIFNKHIRLHSQEKKFECEYCQKVFDKQKNLAEHFRLQHKQDGEAKRCQICDKEFINNALLKNHLKTHDKCFRCKLCDKVFSSRYNLEIHNNSHSGAKNFKCEVCYNNFASKTSLKNHMATHSEERQYQCEICAKTFKTTRRLYTHSLSHATEEKYECEVCQQKFKVKQYLKAHMYRHSKVKPFSCDICQKRFKHKKTKEKHMKGGKHQPFDGNEQCSFCDKTFKEQDLLLEHFEKVHHQENVLNQYEDDVVMKDEKNEIENNVDDKTEGIPNKIEEASVEN